MQTILLIFLLSYPDSARILGQTRHSGGIGGSLGNRVIARDSRGWIHCVYSSGVGRPYASDVPSDIYYVFSADNGITWSTPMNVSNIDTCNSDEPNLAIDSRDILHLVWRQFYEGTPTTRGERLVYSYYENGTWSEPVKISTLPSTKAGCYSSLVIDSLDRVHVVWDDGTGPGNWDIFYSYQIEDTWALPYNISQDPYDSAFPALAIDRNNHLHLVYRTRIARWPTMYSKYNGVYWSIPEVISDTLAGGRASIVVDSDCNPHISFFGGTYYRTKMNNQWTSPQTLIIVDDTSPTNQQLAIDANNNLYLVFQAHLQSVTPRREEIFYKTFNGAIWSPTINITQDTSRSWTPKLGNPVHPQGVDLMWLDLDPTQQYPWILDVVYMRLNPVSAGIEEDRSSLTADRLLLKIYPNPSKSLSVIRYSLPAETKVSLQLYDISGRMVKTLVAEVKKPGNYSFALNSKSLSSGVYFLSLQTEDKRIIERLVVIK